MAHSWFTDHARMQQRGIARAAIEILLSYGRSANDHQGCEVLYVSKAARELLVKRHPAAAYAAERFSRTYPSLAPMGS